MDIRHNVVRRHVKLAVTASEADRLTHEFMGPIVQKGSISGFLKHHVSIHDLLAERRYSSYILPRKSLDDWWDSYLDHSQRIVCLLDRSHVVKFGCPQNAYTGGQNRQEALLWAYLRSTPLRNFFTGVIGASSDGAWIITERADLAPTGVCAESERVQHILKSSLSLDDLTLDNMGYHNITGKLVCRDYGYTDDIADAYHLRRKRGRCGACVWCQLRQRLDDSLLPSLPHVTSV